MESIENIESQRITTLTPGPDLQLIYAHLLSKSNLQYEVLAGKKAAPDSGISVDQQDEMFINWEIFKY